MGEMLIDSVKFAACNTAEADAIRAKTGGSSPIPYDYANNKGFADAIAAIPTGGGGSGYAKKTGSFVLATDYIYEGALSGGRYTGSILVDTGLSKIYSVILWTDEWANKTMDNVNGVGCYFAIDKLPPVGASANSPASYYISYGVFKANTNYYYAYTDKGGIVLHSASADVPEGYFGFQARNSAYGIKAGYTVRWEAVGEE